MAKRRDPQRETLAHHAGWLPGRTPRAPGPTTLAITSDPGVVGAGGGPAFALPATLVITDVRSFADALRQAVAQGDVALDVARLVDIDTAGLQLLCATRSAAISAGRSFRWVGDSAGLRRAATATGLAEALGLAA